MRKIQFYNSLTRQKQEFVPNVKGKVGLYTCGPTVYDRAHIGNLLAYVIWDVLKRYLRSQKYTVKHIMNLTDVGHLVSDADEGEDKLEKASRREKTTAWDIADKYIKLFKEDSKKLNILPPTKYLRATDTIKEQIEFAKILDKKGFLYRTRDGMYFDTGKLADYGKLARISEIDLQAGARVERGNEIKHLTDFAVWKFSPTDKRRDMEWDSPWGKGFPGWHLECSVMSRMTLGDNFDIHTGGEDHLPVHHPNEMAQSEAVTGKLQANFWLHNSFLKWEGGKMSKSSGKFATLEDLKKKNIWPESFRYLILQNHYRTPLNFSWEALQSAQNALKNIVRQIAFFDKPKIGIMEYEEEFYAALADDLNTPRALAVLQKTLDADMPTSARMKTILEMDKILGLDLAGLRKKALSIPAAASVLLKKRQVARQHQDWAVSDKLREELKSTGVEPIDTDKGQKAIYLNY